MEKQGKESRQFPRVKLTTPVRIQVRGGEYFSRTLGENISETGFCFTNSDFIAPSTPVMLEIAVLSRVLRPIGKIVWSMPFPRSNKYRLGTEFVEFDASERRFLADFVNLAAKN